MKKSGNRFTRTFCAVIAATSATAASATDLSNSITGSQGNVQYRLFEPDIAPGQKAPLVLFLHGMGERGTDNVKQTTWINGLVNNTRAGEHAAFVLAPQIDTTSWFQSYSNTPTAAMTQTIAALKKVINTENVDTSRIYVTGLSMGGMGTWDILDREPGLFAAAVPLSGGGDERTVAKFKDTPVWAFHGSADTVVPVTETRSMIGALRAAGGDPKYTEIAGGGHTIWNSVYDDKSGALYDWLFDQHLGSSTDFTPPLANTAAAAPVLSTDFDAAAVLGNDNAVPEPGTIGCLALAGLATLARRNRRRA